MKERPILFSAPMVLALLDGSKTQTRRVVKPEGAVHIFQFRGTTAAAGADEPTGEWGWCGSERVVHKHIRCPYGQPGDRLWVRETWRERVPDQDGRILDYRADHFSEDPCNEPWKPSIYMPREASRITLEIASVRIERLNDISEADARAEGVTPQSNGRYHCGFDDGKVECRSPVTAYAWLWNSINGLDSWSANPWVWVVEFKVVKP